MNLLNIYQSIPQSSRRIEHFVYNAMLSFSPPPLSIPTSRSISVCDTDDKSTYVQYHPPPDEKRKPSRVGSVPPIAFSEGNTRTLVGRSWRVHNNKIDLVCQQDYYYY